MELKNKTAVITGASDGIGKQIALKLAKEKVDLVLIGRNKDRLNQVASECKKLGSKKTNFYVCDLQKTNQIKETITAIRSDFNTIHILINNAGIWQKLSQLDTIEENIVDSLVQTNLLGLIHITRLLLPSLRKGNEAALINISSKSGVVAQASQSVYTATKYGVRGFTEVLKADLKETNVRVAGIYQSGTRTEMFNKTGQDFPIQKFTDPAHLADVIVFMLSRPKNIWLHDIRVQY